MNKKHVLFSGLFTISTIIIFILSMVLNKGIFEPLMHESVVTYELRQVLCILLLYGVGYGFLTMTMRSLDAKWQVLFAFPVGMCLMVLTSFVILLIGIPFALCTVLGAIVLLFLCIFIGIRISPKKHDTSVKQTANLSSPASFQTVIPLHLTMLGIAFLCSTGFLYVMITYDSLFYFINYGRALTIFKSFSAIAGANSYTLTNITQFWPLVCSYTAFFGLDQAFQIQAFLSVNVVLCFFFGLKQTLLKKSPNETCKVTAFSLLMTLLLLTSTSFLVNTSWFVANMPCMAYIFFLFLVAVLYQNDGMKKNAASLFIAFCLTALALLRKDGIIFDAFFLIWMCTIELFPVKRLASVFAPASILDLIWLAFVRLGINATVKKAYFSSLANNKNIALVVAVIAGTYLYIFFGHKILQALCKKLKHLQETDVLYIGMLFLFMVTIVMKGDLIVDNVDFAIRNIFYYPSSWGISGLIFGLLLVFAFIAHPTIREPHFVWIGYAFLNLISYCFVDSKAFWLNWDDSYNRVLMQIVPVFLYMIALELWILLNKKVSS